MKLKSDKLFRTLTVRKNLQCRLSKGCYLNEYKFLIQILQRKEVYLKVYKTLTEVQGDII